MSAAIKLPGWHWCARCAGLVRLYWNDGWRCTQCFSVVEPERR